jgi:hypothetical protein
VVRTSARTFAHRQEQIVLTPLPDVVVSVHDLLPILDR